MAWCKELCGQTRKIYLVVIIYNLHTRNNRNSQLKYRNSEIVRIFYEEPGLLIPTSIFHLAE